MKTNFQFKPLTLEFNFALKTIKEIYKILDILFFDKYNQCRCINVMGH